MSNPLDFQKAYAQYEEKKPPEQIKKEFPEYESKIGKVFKKYINKIVSQEKARQEYLERKEKKDGGKKNHLTDS